MVAEAEDVFGSGALPKKILADGSLSSEGRTPRGKLRMSQLHERWQRVAELPDHFEAPNTEPFDKVKTDTTSDVGTIHYDGEFRLANTVQCNGKSLRPGRYSVSIRYDGKVARATLNQDGQAIGIGGVVHRQAHRMGNDALIVELQGTTRRLSAIQVAKLDFFVLDQEPENSTHSEPRRIERLPLTETVRDPQASPKS